MSVVITILKNNQPSSPLTREEVAQQLASGEVNLEDLAFIEGLSNWTPLQEVLLKVDGKPPVPVMTPAHPYAVTMQPPVHLQYGPFWERFFAYIIDTLILGGVFIVLAIPFSMVVGLLGGFNANDDNEQAATMLGFFIGLLFLPLFLGGGWLYYALLESSAAQGTFGKRLLGLKVADVQGKRIGFGRASGRFFGKLVSGFIPFAIGYIMAAFTERKQALHDMIASTVVVK